PLSPCLHVSVCFLHPGCVGQLRGEQPSYLKGDNFFKFSCSHCSEDGKESFERMRLTWQQVTHTHTHTHAETSVPHTHTHTHTRSHRHRQMCTTHTHTHTNTHTRSHRHIHICTH